MQGVTWWSGGLLNWDVYDCISWLKLCVNHGRATLACWCTEWASFVRPVAWWHTPRTRSGDRASDGMVKRMPFACSRLMGFCWSSVCCTAVEARRLAYQAFGTIVPLLPNWFSQPPQWTGGQLCLVVVGTHVQWSDIKHLAFYYYFGSPALVIITIRLV